MFSFWCLMRESPVKLVVILLGFSIIVFGYCYWVFEQDFPTDGNKNFNYLSNTFWLSIITMTTVGYGDFFPWSIFTKIIGIICAFFGVFVVSLFVITLTNYLNMDGAEERSFSLLQKLEDWDGLLTWAT